MQCASLTALWFPSQPTSRLPAEQAATASPTTTGMELPRCVTLTVQVGAILPATYPLTEEPALVPLTGTGSLAGSTVPSTVPSSLMPTPDPRQSRLVLV